MNKNAILCLLLLTPAIAFACRCKQQSLEYYYDQADLVFVGSVSSVNRKQRELHAKITLHSPLYKGTINNPNFVIQTPISSATCGVPFKTEQSYLIFANRLPNGFQAHLCNGTRAFSVHSPQSSANFKDINVEMISKKLYNLFIQKLINENGIGGTPKSDSLIGLLEIGLKADGMTFSNPLALYSKTSSTEQSPILITQIEEVRNRELGYETPAFYLFSA